MWSQPWTLLDHRRMRAEAAIHLGELQAYVTSPDDDEMFRHGVEFENSDISQVVDVGQPRHVGHGRSSADVEEHLAGLEQSTVDATVWGPSNLAWPRMKVSRSMPSNHDWTLTRSIPRDLVLARLDSWHVDGDLARTDAVVGAAAGQMSSVGTCHQRFGRVDAGAADQLALDERAVWPVSVRRTAKNGPA